MDYKADDLLCAKQHFAIEYVKKPDGNTMPSNHYHQHHEIYYQLSGERYYFIKDRTYHIKKGDLVLIPMYELHKTLSTNLSSYERILINFTIPFFHGLFTTDDINLLHCFQQEVHVLRFNIAEQSIIENLLFKMLQEQKAKASGFLTALKILLADLLLFSTRYALQLHSDDFEFPSTIHQKVSEIVKYINVNFPQNLTLQHISEQFYISPYYFCRIFKEVTGFTFVEYLNLIRIKEAQNLLLNTSSNVTQISQQVGFDNPTHFGRVFKSNSGFSPLQYKKMMRPLKEKK